MNSQWNFLWIDLTNERRNSKKTSKKISKESLTKIFIKNIEDAFNCDCRFLEQFSALFKQQKRLLHRHPDVSTYTSSSSGISKLCECLIFCWLARAYAFKDQRSKTVKSKARHAYTNKTEASVSNTALAYKISKPSVIY